MDQPLDRGMIEELLEVARTIPRRIEAKTIRDDLNALAQFDMAAVADVSDFRITENCRTDVYYHTLRPYLFGFDDVVYCGVAAFGGRPMTFCGGAGAQSSVSPAIKTLLGLRHAEGGLSAHLTIMIDDMPKPHRQVLHDLGPMAIRGFVIGSGDPNLRDICNLCLEKMVDFRSLHLKMAHAFIEQKVTDPRGTGGTELMKWLTILRDETAEQLIAA